MGGGVQIGDLDLNGFLFADDVGIVTDSVERMQAVLRVAENHAKENRCLWSVEKSVVLGGLWRNGVEGRVRLYGVELLMVAYFGVVVNGRGVDMRRQVEMLAGKAQWAERRARWCGMHGLGQEM